MQDRGTGATAVADRCEGEEDTVHRLQIAAAQSDETVGLICVDAQCTVLEIRAVYRPAGA
ncbi:MAG TPA: hypothetical protein ENH00_12355 [Actinobacteria bacterium]|nr:hypothetical protein BMS3Bbin01_01631 [bacterium BMS3Bbin01]HDH26964.1 hypothetical protein [Actinomycetota bacterium]